MLSISAHSLNIAIASSEAVPYAKTGGLADVVGALSVELVKLGHRVTLILPGYPPRTSGRSRQAIMQLAIPTHEGTVTATVEEELVPVVESRCFLRVWFVCYDPYFDRPGLYQHDHRDYPDNLDRFTLFCRGVLQALCVLVSTRGERVDVLHLHDWQTALCAVYLKVLQNTFPELDGLKSLFTLHNVGYQGIFPSQQFSRTGLPSSVFSLSGIEFYGMLNCLKGGIIFSDAVSTVSATYAKEILTAEYGCGLEGVLANRVEGIKGIVNGIDVSVWDPEHDRYLPARYSAIDLSGKHICKSSLQKELRLPNSKVPLLAAIGRLTTQKGFDLLIDIIPELMVLDIQMAILGIGDDDLERQLLDIQSRHPNRIGLHLGFDEGLAHRIEAAADIVIMPSRYEPCGLTQLYSLRYGTVPIVRHTGGLADTVVPFRPSTVKAGCATGFHFQDDSSDSLLSAIMLSLQVHKEGEIWQSLVRAGMTSDVSWTQSAKLYVELYQQISGKTQGTASERPMKH